MSKNSINRRDFIIKTGILTSGAILSSQMTRGMFSLQNLPKKRIALVGTGSRGTSFMGKNIRDNFNDVAEFVGLCDINEGRVNYAKKLLGVDCQVFTDFNKMIKTVPIDLLFVATVDSTHDEFIIKGLLNGMDVVTEKPMTTDEVKCKNILEAEKKSGKKLIMSFNYRYGLLFSKLKELLLENHIGKVTSVDFNWYLNTYHGADYFRRWHGIRERSGTLLLHKAAHHFDLINWWVNSEPIEVNAFGSLEFYGDHSTISGKNCRKCNYQKECKFYMDITKDDNLMKLYVDNEKYDGYIRDNCLFRKEINIFDKMSVQIKYANNILVTYSLSTYSPYEGFRIAFNGTDGRLETWEGIPWLEKLQEDQSKIYEQEMNQESHTKKENKYHEITIMKNFDQFQRIEFPFVRSGHWGGDALIMDKILRGNTKNPDLHCEAGTREGAMGILVGIAARKSIDENRMVKIAELTDLVPKVKVW